MRRKTQRQIDDEASERQRLDDADGERVCRCGHDRSWHEVDLSRDPAPYACMRDCECGDFCEGVKYVSPEMIGVAR